MKVVSIIGTRPEIIKMAPIVRALEKKGIDHILIHSDQHYDEKLSKQFFRELDLREPDYGLDTGSRTPTDQVGNMLMKLEPILMREKPDIILAEGDTNTVLAAALHGFKSGVPFGHVEAGIRSFDRTMPEEVNRVLADSCSGLLFAPTSRAAVNLLRYGIDPSRIFLTGNTIVDACEQHLKIAEKKSDVMKRLGLKEKDYYVATVHRQENVDDKDSLEKIVEILLEASATRKVVFPVHPRTEARLKAFGLREKLEEVGKAAADGAAKSKGIIMLEPVGYLDFLMLFRNAAAVLTDSGGVQEEASILGVPCVTLRYNTERPESVEAGVNFLVGTDREKALSALKKIECEAKAQSSELGKKLEESRRIYGDGRTGERIVDIIIRKHEAGELKEKAPDFTETGCPELIAVHVGGSGAMSGKKVSDAEKEFGVRVLTIFREGKAVFPSADERVLKNDIAELSVNEKDIDKVIRLLGASG